MLQCSPRSNKAFIAAGIRHAKEQIGLDLSPALTWLRFLEVHYQRAASVPDEPEVDEVGAESPFAPGGGGGGFSENLASDSRDRDSTEVVSLAYHMENWSGPQLSAAADRICAYASVDHVSCSGPRVCCWAVMRWSAGTNVGPQRQAHTWLFMWSCALASCHLLGQDETFCRRCGLML